MSNRYQRHDARATRGGGENLRVSPENQGIISRDKKSSFKAYMTRDVMILMGANPFRGPLEEVGPENRDFIGP